MSSILWKTCVHGVLYFLVLQLLVHSISAQIHYFPTANVSTSWKINNTKPFDGSMVDIILSKEASGPRLACGFFCNGTSDAYLFAIFYINYSIRVVWSANRNYPVGKNGTLQFKSDGDLVLKNDDGSIVWSTNTSGKSVAGLNLTETGNPVLFDHYNATVWESFDHPTDCLLPGQKLRAGQRLTPSVSPTNWTEVDLLSLSVTDKGMFASAGTSHPQVYNQLVADGVKKNKEPTYVRFLSGSLALFYNSSETSGPVAQIYVKNFASSEQYMRFGCDGHLRVYEWGVDPIGDWEEVDDLFTAGHGECSYPTVCGKYGICKNGQCSCPQPTIYGVTYFKPLNNKKPNLGCNEVTPLSCEASSYSSTFLGLKDTTYFTFFISREGTQNVIPEGCKINFTLERCKVICSKNCSCKAVVFQCGSDPAIGNCYFLSQIFSFKEYAVSNSSVYFKDMEYAVSNSCVYIKVQNVTQKHNVSTAVAGRKKRSRTQMMLRSSIIVSFVLLTTFFGSLMLIVQKKGNADEAEEDYLDQVPGMPTRFSYEHLKAMTENFGKLLGKGGFGSVFEGTLADGTKIAVKQLDGLDRVRKSFLTEVETIGSIHHVNLVRLLGFCAEKFHRLLVYEYMSNASLDKWIFHKTPEFVLDFKQRKKIILDIAKGLSYLHEDCRQKIIHLDIKPQNILLDDNFNAKISDFGLSKLIDRDQSKVVTTMRGTPGYLAPEWLRSEITEKVDIYSLGVVILEILCRRRNFDRSQHEERVHLLTALEKNAEEDQLLDLVDDQGEDMQIHGAEILNVMKVAAWCLQSGYAKRPSMSVVVNVLEGVTEVENNLDYNLSNPTLRRMPTKVTPLLPSVLSGPC